VVLLNLEVKKLFLALLSYGKNFQLVIRIHLRAIKYEQTKKIVVFAQLISQSMLTKLTAFETLPE